MNNERDLYFTPVNASKVCLINFTWPKLISMELLSSSKNKTLSAQGDFNLNYTKNEKQKPSCIVKINFMKNYLIKHHKK